MILYRIIQQSEATEARVRFKVMCRRVRSLRNSPERHEAMESTKVSDEEIVRRLSRHPQIRSRVAELLAVVEDSNGDLRRADDAEDRLIEEVRSLGRAAMQSWAQGQVIQSEQEVRQSGRAHREGKKNSTGTPPLAT